MMSKKALLLGQVYSIEAILLFGLFLMLEFRGEFMYFLIIFPAGFLGWFIGRKDERELREEEDKKK